VSSYITDDVGSRGRKSRRPAAANWIIGLSSDAPDKNGSERVSRRNEKDYRQPFGR